MSVQIRLAAHMKEILAGSALKAQTLEQLKRLVIVHAFKLKKQGFRVEYVGGPISADGPTNILENLERLSAVADALRAQEGIRIYCNPYVGDLRRFPGMDEPDFTSLSTDLLRSGVFQGLRLLQGWERSTGSSAEYEVAQKLGLIIQEVPLTILG